MVCFVPSVCFSIRESCQRRDCSELGTVRNWVDHCIYYVYRTNSLHSAVGYSSGTGQLASEANRPVPDDLPRWLFVRQTDTVKLVSRRKK